MFKFRKIESAIAHKLFAFSFVIAASYIAARTVADSLFLSQVGSDQLALVYVIAGFGTAIFAAFWYLLTRKMSVSRSIQVSSVAFAVLTFAAWYWLPSMESSFWMLASIYLLAEVKGCVNAVNIVSALNTKLGRDASKSTWAFVGISAPIAAMLVGGVLAAESQLLTSRDWLLLIALSDLVAGAIGFLLSREKTVKQNIESRRAASDSADSIRVRPRHYVSATKFQKWIGILFCAKILVLTIVSFEWKASASDYFHGQSDQLVRYFGIYYSVVGFATIALQAILTSRFLQSRKFGFSLLFLPICIALFATIFFFGATPLVLLLATTGAKSTDSFRRSVHDTSLNLLHTTIKRERRRDVISINRGIVKPISEVVASSAIYFGALQFHRPLLAISIIVWLVAARNLVALTGAFNKATPQQKSEFLLRDRTGQRKRLTDSFNTTSTKHLAR